MRRKNTGGKVIEFNKPGDKKTEKICNVIENKLRTHSIRNGQDRQRECFCASIT